MMLTNVLGLAAIALLLMPLVCAAPGGPGALAGSDGTSPALPRRLQSSDCVVPYTESMCRATRDLHGHCTFYPAGMISGLIGSGPTSSASCLCTISTHCPGSWGGPG